MATVKVGWSGGKDSTCSVLLLICYPRTTKTQREMDVPCATMRKRERERDGLMTIHKQYNLFYNCKIWLRWNVPKEHH